MNPLFRPVRDREFDEYYPPHRRKVRRGQRILQRTTRTHVERRARKSRASGESRGVSQRTTTPSLVDLLIKLGIRVSPPGVSKYMPKRPPGQPRGDRRWATFLRNHARAILACDFFVAVTATFQLLYVFVVIEHGRRRLAHVSVTKHPTADWTLQQMREVVGEESAYRYLIHDRDSIFATRFDNAVRALGLKVLRTPFRSPKANSICGAPGDRQGVIGESPMQ